MVYLSSNAPTDPAHGRLTGCSPRRAPPLPGLHGLRIARHDPMWVHPVHAGEAHNLTNRSLECPVTEHVRPDRSLVSPVTELGWPDTELALPDTELALPDTELALPDTELALPDTELALPDTELAGAVTELERPDTELAGPVTALARPDTELECPDTELGCPDAELAGQITRCESLPGALVALSDDVDHLLTVHRRVCGSHSANPPQRPA